MPTDPKALAQELTEAYASKTIVATPSSREGGLDLGRLRTQLKGDREGAAGGRSSDRWLEGRLREQGMWRALKLDTLCGRTSTTTLSAMPTGTTPSSRSRRWCRRDRAEVVFKLARRRVHRSGGGARSDGVVRARVRDNRLRVSGLEVPAGRFRRRARTARGAVVGEPVYVRAGRHRAAGHRTWRHSRCGCSGTTRWSRKRGKKRAEEPGALRRRARRALKRRGGEHCRAGDIISTGTLTRRCRSPPATSGSPRSRGSRHLVDATRHEFLILNSEFLIPTPALRGIAAPSCRGSEARSGTPEPSLITACPVPERSSARRDDCHLVAQRGEFGAHGFRHEVPRR